MLKKLLVGFAVLVGCFAGMVGMVCIMGDRAEPFLGYAIFTNNMTPSMAVYELTFIVAGSPKLEETVAAPVGADKELIPWSESPWPNKLKVRSGKGETFHIDLPKGKRSITITESSSGTRIFVDR